MVDESGLSDHNVDAVLTLANSLNISFATALKLYKSGHRTAASVKELDHEVFARITGVSLATARTILHWKGAPVHGPEKAKEAIVVEPVEKATVATIVEPAEVDGDTGVPRPAEERDFVMHPLEGEPVAYDPNVGPRYGVFYSLDPEIRHVWWLSTVPAWLLFFIACIFPLAIISPMLVLIIFIVSLILLVTITSYWVELNYNNYQFGFTNELIIVKQGIWWKNEVHIPFGRIQNINSHQGILDRMFDVWHLGISVTGAYSMIHGVPCH
jgi:membrane protein YdbS with pleckstrin-like domain